MDFGRVMNIPMYLPVTPPIQIIIDDPALKGFFFFQAEDGIRDPLVTGVQTCALPISRRAGQGTVLGCCFNALLSERRARKRDRGKSPSRVFDANYHPARPIPREGECHGRRTSSCSPD